MKKHSGIKLIAKVKRAELSNRALVLCSQFSRELKSLDGQGLVLQDPLLTQAIATALLSNHSDRLSEVFEKLLSELQLDTDIENLTYRGSKAKKAEPSLTTNSDTSVTSEEPRKVKMYRGAPIDD